MTANSDPTGVFKSWMDERRLKAADVCGDFQVSEQAIHNWRSSGVPRRRWEHVERYMREWVDPATVRHAVSDEAVRTLAESRQNLVLRPSEEEFEMWDKASRAAGAPSLKEWALNGLNELAGLPKQQESTGTDG